MEAAIMETIMETETVMEIMGNTITTMGIIATAVDIPQETTTGILIPFPALLPLR